MVLFVYNINKFCFEGELYYFWEKLWVGYLIYLGLISVYYLGDIDVYLEILNIDYFIIWLILIGGKYVMIGKEVVELVMNFGVDIFIFVYYDFVEIG